MMGGLGGGFPGA
jgi:ubiquilin